MLSNKIWQLLDVIIDYVQHLELIEEVHEGSGDLRDLVATYVDRLEIGEDLPTEELDTLDPIHVQMQLAQSRYKPHKVRYFCKLVSIEIQVGKTQQVHISGGDFMLSEQGFEVVLL